MAETCSKSFSKLTMEDRNLEFDDIFTELCPKRYNEFGLKREMRFISERIIVEYDPSDTLSVREIMHPMDPFRCHEPFFTHSLADKSKNEYVTAIDFHEHITYFPYAKNTGDICLARYISNFNDINFTKISGQNLFSLPQETIHGLRVGRLDKGMIAVNHRSGLSLESTVTVIDLVKPSRNIAYFDSPIPVNTIDWIWHGPFHLAIGDNKALRIVDVRCPKSLNAVFFENGVKKTALSSTRPLEIACWDGRNILLYDVRRPEVPCNIFKIDLNAGETLLDMKFNPYLTNELFLHTSNYRVMAMQVNPAALIGGRALSNTMYDKWQIITFKHIDRGCTATRHTMKRRENMPCEEVEVPLLDYYDQFEAAKGDEEIPFPTTWQLPSEVDNSIFDRLHEISEYDFEGYLSKAVERVSAEHEYHSSPPKKLYETDGVESFDFVFPGVNGIMCFDRKHFTYRIEVSPKHYEGSVNTYAGSDSVFYYRGLQIQEMIPAQTLTMMCNRLEAGWNAYETSETTLKQLAFKITERNRSMWANWLRNSAIIQYGGKEFVPIGENGMSWKQLVPQLDGPLPEIDLPPYEQPREEEAAGEICKMIAPFFRLFLPDPRPDLPDVQDEELEGPLAPPDNPHRDDAEEKQEFEMSLPSELSQNMRTLCKCHAKMRYYQKKSNERKYMYNPMQKGFFIASSQRIRDKFFRLGWRYVVKPQIMSHRVKVDRRVFKYDVFNDLKKFDRVKPREFQKRVLPPKLIMDSSSVFMKPEYIKEREEKEREMRAKAAQPITAPIGMSLPKLTKQSHDDSRNGSTNTSMLSVASMEEDPERARFMIRAALQLADNDDDNQTTTNPPTPVTATTASTSTASTPVPSAHSTVSTRENDDFEYETAEDAFFGIKKKRMYVVYQPATAPLGLKRYKPDRLSEHTFIRRLEHLMYWGKRRHERKILEGDFEENDKRLSSIKERCTLDLKAALNNHLRVGWQTFYDKYFFFSDKCSYNQLIRKAIQMYNSMCHSGYVKTSFNVAQHERMVFGLKPRFLLKNGLKNLREILELRTGCSMIETTIPKFNHFMNFIQAELPYQIDDLSIQPTEYSPNFRVYKEGELNSQKKKPTAVYDRNDDFMFPTGRLRFCEFEIPPSLMSQIKKQRKPANRKKARCIYLEDLASIRKNTTVHCVRRSQSCPDLALGIFASEEMNYDDEVYTDGVRHYMSEMFLKELREKEQKLDEKEYVTQNETLFGTKITINNSVEHVEKAQNRVSQGTTFVEWDSPMIFVTDGITGENVSRRVVPFPEPQPPRQIKEADSVFEDIPLEVRMSAAKNLHISWLINQPILHTYPGIQILDDERDEMFTLSSTLPRWSKEKRLSRMAKGHEHFINYEKMANEIVSMGLSFDGYDQFVISDETLENEIGYNRLRTPVFEEHSIQHIPSRLMEIMNPSFYGTFDLDKKSRYTIPELAEMRNRRQLQQEILEKRMIRLREPVIEETEHELRREEDLNVEEDDLKTSSDEDESVSTLQPVLQADQEVLIPSMPDSPYSEEDREKIFAIGEDDEEIVGKSGEAREENLVRRKLGVSHDTTEQKIINEKETACGAKHIKDSSTNFDISNDNVICETEAPFGSPVKIVPIGDARDLMANVTKEPKSVTWGGVVEHQIIRPNPSQESRHVDMNFLRELYSMQFSRRVKSSENLPNWLPVRKNSDPTALSLSKGLPRRSSLDQFYKSDEVSSCAACVEEPWPTREICIVCHPDAQIYRCTNIMNLNLPCNTCNSNIYKFSCANYERHASVVNKYRTEFDGVKLETVDNTLKEALAAKVKPAEELSAPWNNRPYRSGEYTAEKLFEACTDRFFQHSQRNQLAEFYHREFHWITWHMDDVKAEKIFVSEQFDVAFDRDADIDMMRDTMNTISQDGEMDMMTTYDQRSGMRIRRWISYSALHTRVQKQNEKVARRKRAAERESKILSGEISVEAAILADIQKRKAKEEAAAKAQVVDVVKTEEERRKAYQLWKKLPIPKFVEDPKQEMPNFKAPKSEDWLESSGSEDELPPIRSRILSKEITEFIYTIKRHMAKKPENFDGLRVTYGKLFERRPILKNDIVLVTKKKKLKRKPPLRSQKLPLDNTWLNDCLKVAILPPPMTINYPKDSNKWTVPFYSSQLMQLSTRERKERAFRPPTPPPTLKKEYAIMKQLERDFYRKMRINLQKSTKRARIARVMRFRRKLVRFRNIGTLARINKSTNRWEKKWSKAWTTAYRQTLVPISRQSHSVPKLPKQPIHKKYIFAYGHQKLRWRLEKLGQSQQSRLFSSSDSEYCPIVILPSKHHEETKRMVSKNSIKKKKCHSFGNFGKMVTQLNHGLDKPKSTDFVRSVQNYHHDASAFEIGESKRVSRKREKDGKPRQMESENKLKMADVLSKRRSRSVPRQFGRKPRLQITSTRSFSVDIDSRRRKELKRLIRKVAKNSKISLDAPSLKELRLVRKNQTSSTIPVEKSDLAEKPFVVANRSLKDSKKFTILSAQRKTSNWTQKERKMESTRLKQIINCRAIKKSCNNYKRPLFPIPLLNSHEADGNDCFLYGRNHTRQKHFTKRRKVLHHAPTRSRVLNTIRKLKETEKRNKEMMCEKPITPKLVDLHLNPWIPLSRKKLNAASLSIKKTSNFPTLSWHRMLKKLTNYHVKISRVRLDSMQKIKKMKELTDGSDEHTVEIMMEPTPNLKSCLKRGNAARRVLNLFSNPVEKMNQGLVLHEPIQSSTSSFQGADAQTPKSEKSVPKLLKYSFGNVPEENSLIEENGKEITTENVTKEVNTRPDTPLVVDIDDKLNNLATRLPLRLLKPVAEPLQSAGISLNSKEPSATSPAKTIVPPGKLPVDQQWRAAMMARRNMGSNRNTINHSSSPSSTKHVLKTDAVLSPRQSDTPTTFSDSMSQNPVNRRTATKVEEGSEGNTTLLQSSDRRESKKNSIDDSVAMPNSKVSPPLRLVDQMMRQTPMDDLPTIPSLSSPQRNERPMLEPLENIVWPIEVEHVIDLVPDTSESRRRSPNVKSRNHSSVKSNESAQNQNGSNSDPPKKKSFFEKMFSNNKPSSPETQSTQETTSTEEIPILKPVRHETSPDGRGGEPLLPRIKKPESGQLARRKQKQPSQKSHTGQIVKIVDGKPVRDSTSLQRHPSKRRPEPPPAPPANNSSDEDDVLIRVGAPFMATSSSPEAFDDADYPPPVVTSVKTSKAEQKAFAEASQVRIPDTSQRPGKEPSASQAPKQVTVEVMANHETSNLQPTKSASGKSVTFGPTYSYGPVPSVDSKTSSPSKHIVQASTRTIIDSSNNSSVVDFVNPSVAVLEEQSIFQVAAKFNVSQTPAESSQGLQFEGKSDSTTRTPSKRQRHQEQMTPSKINGSTRESSKLTAEPGKSCAPDTRQVSDSSSSEKNYKISPSNEKTEGSESTRLSRKHSTRRQLKMGIPSALQLSGNSSLPRPAKPSPERPPILDPPKEVKNYKSPSQRRYYTRIGEDWKSPNSRRPESSENDEEEASASHTDSYQKKQKKKRAKKRKRKPDTPEPTLVLDGTERLSKLTAENLKLLDREYDVEYNSRSFSIVASGDDDDDHCLPPKELLRVYGAIKNAPIEIDNETARVEVDFDPCLDTKIVTAINLPPDNRKFETSLKKFRRMMKSKQQRIKESGLKRQSKQEAAIRAIHQVRKVRFLQTHKTKLMTPVSTDFKPKSILKPATQPVTWWYRIDSEGNKRYLKRFEPSEWQQRMENKSVPKEIAPKLTPKKKISYLKCWANVMNKLGSEKLLQDFKENPNVSLLPEKKKIVQPVDVIIDVPTFGNHPPSRSESWTSSCSSTSSLNSLFDDHPAGDKETGCSEISDTTKVNKTMSQSPEALYQTASSIESKDTSGKNESTGKTNSEEYPVVFFGMTVARSPSPSTSNADALEAIETVAEDGSQIVEYVGQEEVSEEAARHRFDPFVRPLSALFKAFSSTEVGMEAGGRSRSINRRSRLGGFFRRQSLPNLSGLATRPESSSPVRRRRNPYSMSSMSQESSAEDILALMQEQPNALENMEEEEEKKGKKVDRRVFPPLELPEILPSGIPMFNPRKKLRNSLYRQFEQQKNSSIQKKVDEYYSYNLDLDTSLNCSTMRNLVYFNIGEYLRLNRYPRPSMKFSLLGKCWSKSLKFYGASPTTSDRAAAMVSKKVKNSCIRLEKTKRLLTLTEEAMKKMCKSTSRKSRKIRVQYKFKKTCVKYRIKVTIPEKSRKILLGEKFKKSDEITPPLCHIPHIVTTISTSTRAPQPSTACAVDDYDGDNDSEMENRNPTEINLTNKVVIRQNQRQALLKRYFQFAVSMARKVTKRSLGPTKPFMFYAFVSQMKARMRQFMDLRRVERQKLCDMQRRKSILARNGKKNARYRKKRMEIRNVKPFSLRDALKFGNTTKKQVVVEQTKFALRKKNARVEAFFECLDEYIDVGTPIQLVFRSKNTILPRMVFDSKIKMVDSDIYFSQSPCHTDSDFSSDTPAEPKDTEKTNFFNRDNLESTYRVKGLPGLIYLAKLVQARVGDDIERNIPFDGPGMDFTQLQVYMSPIRRLMLNSLGLRMPDRLEGIKLMKNQNEKFGLWFGRLFRMMCYGRGDVCKYIVDILASGQGLPRRNYDKMDVSYQARVVHKLYKKMIYLNNGREARLGVRELTDRGLDLEEENPFAKPFKMGAYDRTLQGDGDPWSRDDWIRAADEFLAKSNENPEVLITSRACVYAMRMIFLGGYSQDIVDDLVPLKIPIRDKLLFIINLTPPDNLVENVIKIFNTVRGLDRLPFVGLGYHADPLQILFDEAVESGDPQLIAHIIRVGRCLDRRSGEPQMVGFNSDHVKKRDFAEIMTDIFANSDAKKPCGAPTMDEMFPFRFVRHDDGTHVAKSTEELANIMECEVTRYMAILELTKGAAVTKGDLDHNKKFNTRPSRFFFDILCTGCKVSVAQARNLGSLGRTLCVSTMPLIEQDKDKKRWPNAKTMSPRLTFENYIETLDPTENKMLMAKDIEEEKTDITVQLLPSRFGCYQCRFSLPRCAVCMCPYLNDHMDYALKEKNERFSQFSVCNICNHGGHINHISEWFATEKFCPVAGCDCRCLRTKRTKNLKGRLRRHMLLSANMRAKSHLCNPDCAVEVDIDDGYLPDPDLPFAHQK